MKSLYEYLTESKNIGNIPSFQSKDDVLDFFENTVGLNGYGFGWLYSQVNGRHVYLKYEKEHDRNIPDDLVINISKTNQKPKGILISRANRDQGDKNYWAAFLMDGRIVGDYGSDFDEIKKNFEEFLGVTLKSGNEHDVIGIINEIVSKLQHMGATWSKVRS